MKTNLIKLACGLALLGAAVFTTQAQSTFTDTFDGAGFGTTWTGANNVQGTGTLSTSTTLANGTYSWSDLVGVGMSLSMNLGANYQFTQADILTDTSALGVILYNGYFAFAGPPDPYSGGSASFLNENNAFIAFSPQNWMFDGLYTFGYYENSTGISGSGTLAGQYAPQTDVLPPVTSTPEPSTLALSALGGLGLLIFRRRK